MEIYKLQQIFVLTVCTLAGGICGIIYDTFRAYRRYSQDTPVKIAVCDILFWSISAAVVYLAIHLSNNAKLRWYEPIGVICGYILYAMYLSKKCSPLLYSCIKTVGKIFTGILKLVCIPKKILHIIILPIEKHTTRAKTRLLYKSRTFWERICTKVAQCHIPGINTDQKLRIFIFKKRRK